MGTHILPKKAISRIISQHDAKSKVNLLKY
jgi:hypothetical protein